MTVLWNYNNMPLLLAELVSQGLADPDPLSEPVSKSRGSLTCCLRAALFCRCPGITLDSKSFTE